MSRFIQHAKIETVTTVALTEDELGALEALAGYGADSFLKVFYEKMGRVYLGPHEKGLRSLFDSITKEVPGILRRSEDARNVFCNPPRIPSPAVDSVNPDKIKGSQAIAGEHLVG